MLKKPMAYPISSDQLREIRELFDQGLLSADIAEQFGIPPRSIIAQRAVYTWQKNQDPDGRTDSSVEDAITTTFGLEKDLQDALRGKIDQLEDGLEIIDGGKERTVKSGRIDITARDSSGRIVVIELKAGEAGRDAIGQVLSYMGDLGVEEKNPIRGFLIAGTFSTSAVSASLAIPNLQLKKYQVHFTFEPVGAG
jgi:hypothetical protein